MVQGGTVGTAAIVKQRRASKGAFREVAKAEAEIPVRRVLEQSATIILAFGRVAELADATDSKSVEVHSSCGFDPHLGHHLQ